MHLLFLVLLLEHVQMGDLLWLLALLVGDLLTPCRFGRFNPPSRRALVAGLHVLLAVLPGCAQLSKVLPLDSNEVELLYVSVSRHPKHISVLFDVLLQANSLRFLLLVMRDGVDVEELAQVALEIWLQHIYY